MDNISNILSTTIVPKVNAFDIPYFCASKNGLDNSPALGINKIKKYLMIIKNRNKWNEFNNDIYIEECLLLWICVIDGFYLWIFLIQTLFYLTHSNIFCDC